MTLLDVADLITGLLLGFAITRLPRTAPPSTKENP